jgi:hypothetical protein
MRVLVLFAVLILAGCATPKSPPPLPGDTAAAAAQIRQWVPLGTAPAPAQATLAAHGFRCSYTPASADSSAAYLQANISWPPGNFLQTNWYCTLRFADDKFASVNVTITSLGSNNNTPPPNVPAPPAPNL